MDPNQLNRFTEAQPERRYEFVYGGVNHVLAGTPFGDDYFDLVFPDARTMVQQCSHYATVNDRRVSGSVRAYPLSIYQDVHAIHRTYQTPEGQEPVDLSTIFAIYDHCPQLFAQLRGFALMATGLTDDVGLNSGKGAWDAILIEAASLERETKRADLPGQHGKEIRRLASSLRQRAALALKDFSNAAGEEDNDDPRDVDSAMESLAGN